MLIPEIFVIMIFMAKEAGFRIFHIIIPLLVVVILWKTTTRGWRSSPMKEIQLTEIQQGIAREAQVIIHFLAVGLGVRNYKNYNNLQRAADYIQKEFQALGYEVKLHEFQENGQIFHNIIAEWPGISAEEVVILGAHYDSCFNPGADDNASGIAGLLLTAKLFKDRSSREKIRFIAFANEEPPFFKSKGMGSWHYVESLKNKKEEIKLAVILEMIGYYSDEKDSQQYMPFLGPFYPNQGNFIAVVSNIRSYARAKAYISSFKEKTDIPVASLVAPGFIPPLDFSDHLSFWAFGYPAVMVTDTAFLRNPNYHHPTDMPETIDYRRMAVVITGLADSLDRFIQESRKQ